MSAVSDVLAGLKKVILLEENVSRLQEEVAGVAKDVRRTRDYAAEIDKRVIRIETMIEMSGRTSENQPRIEK
ncbi:hypothetical protein [Parasphingorhabdus cellanae]|uniref:Uncharacterized protein n=1 Tax=Parasphingorhabdus cellanae TaxID=2806553 RepID=A0ABX7T741_9SPHN|nr:hypothetical protein [Parasphingorhabdus cellanae]QTD56279.1 hypothetical protein J4G78_01345 [Parasphingorhabdus cellanae]